MFSECDCSVDFSIVFSSRSELRQFVKRLPRRNKAEQLELGRIMTSSGETAERREEARLKLIESGMYLLLKHIRNTKDENIFENRVSGGLLGLVEAAKKFDPSRGRAFTTYADKWVFKEVTNSNSNEVEIIRRSREVRRILSKVRQFENEKRNEWGPYRNPTEQEIAMSLKESKRRVESIRNAPSSTVRIVGSFFSDGDELQEYELPSSVSKSVMGDNDHEKGESITYIYAKVDELPWVDSQIVKMRFGLGEYTPHTQKAIAENLHRSEKYVSSHLSRSLDILKKDRNLRAIFEE